jgi:hypothetical protein
MSRSFFACAALAVLWLSASPRAHGQSTGEAPVGAEAAAEADARAHFDAGREAYERELYTEAEDAFLAAYDAMAADDPRRPLILLNVAQAIERQGGRDEDALAMWRRFEQEAQGTADAAVLNRARERIGELEARLRRRGDEPIEAEAAEVDLEADYEALPAEPARRSPHWSGIALTSAGGAMLVAGAVVGIVGLTKRNALLDTCDGTLCPGDARSDADQLDRLALAGDVLLWPGLAIAITGTVLVFTLDAKDDGRTLSASCGLGGCVLGGTF